jgi:hypothetical protein
LRERRFSIGLPRGIAVQVYPPEKPIRNWRSAAVESFRSKNGKSDGYILVSFYFPFIAS